MHAPVALKFKDDSNYVIMHEIHVHKIPTVSILIYPACSRGALLTLVPLITSLLC